VISTSAATAVGQNESHACAWCGAPLDRGSEPLPGRLRCARCAAATTFPPPTEAELAAAYGGWYRPAGGRFAGAGDLLLRWSRGTLARRLDRIAPPGPVLDVGSGDGALLDALHRRGREAIGVERQARRSDVLAAEIEEVGGEWAAIVFWHSLEHLPSAGQALAHAAGLLAPGGLIVLALPNLESIQARLFGERWLALDLPRHLVHIPASAMLRRLEELGLRVERVSFARGGQVVFGWLHGLVGGLPGRPDLYDAIRRPEARRDPLPPARRRAALAAGALLLPLAVAAAGAEIAARRGGTLYVEARRA
jgi:hypothetical protein